MKFLPTFVAFACLTGIAQLGWSQQETQNHEAGILGRLDPKTGAFKPLPQASLESPELAPNLTTVTGKFVAKFTIRVASTLPSTTTIVCDFSASEIEFTTTSVGSSYFESASVPATRSGSTATCTVNIPYSWNVSNPATGTVSLNYSITAYTSPPVVAASLNRQSTHTLPTIKIPASGATTTETIAATF